MLDKNQLYSIYYAGITGFSLTLHILQIWPVIIGRQGESRKLEFAVKMPVHEY